MKLFFIFFALFFFSTRYIISQNFCDDDDQMDYPNLATITPYTFLSTNPNSINRIDFKRKWMTDGNANAQDNEYVRSNNNIGIPYFLPACFLNNDPDNANEYYTMIVSHGFPNNNAVVNNNFYEAQGEKNNDTQSGPTYFILNNRNMVLKDQELDILFWEVNFPDAHRRFLSSVYSLVDHFEVNAEGETVEVPRNITTQYNTLQYIDDANPDYIVQRITEYNTGEPNVITLWRALTGLVDIIPNRNLNEVHFDVTGLIVNNFIESAIQNNSNYHGEVIVSEDQTKYARVFNNRILVYSEEDFENIEESEINSVPPSNTLYFSPTNSDYIPYLNIDQHGRLLVKDANDKSVVATIGDECITSEPFTNHRYLVDNDGNLSASSNSNHLVWSKNKGEEFKCHFPTVGQNSLGGNAKLIQYNQTPDPDGNELTYILNGDLVTIKDDGVLKVVRKDANGHFEPNNPANIVQTFELN